MCHGNDGISERVTHPTRTSAREEPVDATVSAVRDVEDLTRTLQQERDTLQVIMESTNAHIAYLDRDFNFIMVNSTYSHGSGYTKEELVGRNHFDLFPNEENEAIFRQVRDTGEPVSFKAKPFEFADQPLRGVTYWDWILSPVKDDAGQVQGVVLSLVDVTEGIRTKQLSDALNRIAIAISSTVDSAQVMSRALAEAVQATGSETGQISFLEGDYWVVKSAYGFSEDVLGARIPYMDTDYLALAAKTGEPLAISDTSQEPRIRPDITTRFGIRSFLITPLVVRGDVVGILSLHYHSKRVNFTQAETDFATKLGASVSLALENARLFSELQETRDRAVHQFNLLQRALVPAEPYIGEGYSVVSEYAPAYEGEEIGGDFYDVFRTKDEKIGLLIGDVSGKGIEAASLGATCRGILRAFAFDSDGPGEALTRANSVLTSPGTHFSNFVTVLLVILDPDTGAIVYANAGHPPPIIHRSSGECEVLASGGLPIGIYQANEYSQNTGSLEPHDRLLLYTDGVSEARYGPSLFGLSGIIEVLERHRAQPPDVVLDELLNAATKWAHGRLRDDTAVILIERTGRG